MLQIIPQSNNKILDALDDIFSDAETDIVQVTKTKNKIKSLGEISSEVTIICKKLKENQTNFEIEQFFFILTDESTEWLNPLMEQFKESKDYSIFSDLVMDKYTDNIKFQILLLKSTVDEETEFSEIPKGIDSRIASLLHWKISKKTQKGVKCYHLLHSLLEYVQNSEPAPIWTFFDEFKIPSIVFEFCHLIVELFSDSPFLSTVLETLSPFSDNPSKVLSLSVEVENKTTDNILDDTDDSDDSDMFQDLKPMGQAFATSLLRISNISNENPLDNVKPDTMPTQFPEGPSSVTFRFFKNRPKCTAEDFIKWLVKHHPHTKPIFSYDSEIALIPNTYSTSSLSNRPGLKEIRRSPTSLSSLLLLQSSKKINDELLNDLMKKVFDEDVRSLVPTIMDSRYFSMVLPIIHQINSTSTKLFLNGLEMKQIVSNEYEAHIGCKTCDLSKIESSLSFFLDKIKSQLRSAKIQYLTEKRSFPPKETEVTSDLLVLLRLIDYSLLILGYSPISMLHYSFPLPQSEFSKDFLAESLFYLYTRKSYPPYISFRAAFAIALLIGDQNPAMACDFMYEGLFLMMHFYPQLNYLTCIQSAYFELANFFNQTQRYFYFCLAVDNSICVCSTHHSLATKAGSIAMKHKDCVRAVYHYLNAIKLYIQSNQVEEFLYLAQIVASIYIEYDLIPEAIQLITYLFQCHSKIESINSRILATTLCRLYCDQCHFAEALELINELDNCKNQQQVKSLKNRLYLSQNKFKDFYENIKSILTIDSKSPPTSPMVREIYLPNIKALSKAYLNKEDYSSSLFWSEIGCQLSVLHGAPKEMANFFLLRGKILFYVYYSMYSKTIHFLNKSLDDLALSYGHYEDGKYTKTAILIEALSSLTTAINFFEKKGNMAKLLDARSYFLQLVASHILLYHKFLISVESTEAVASSLPISAEDFPFVIKKPQLMSILDYSQENSINFDKFGEFEEVEIRSADQFTQIVKAMQGIADSFYDPLYISILQCISSVLFYLEGNYESTTVLFNHGLANIKKFFFKGDRFIVSDCKISLTNRVYYVLRFYLTFLMELPPDFIQKRLFLFDMMNDVSFLLNYQRTSFVAPQKNRNEPSIDFTPQLANALSDPVYPKFSEMPKSSEKKKVIVSRKAFTLYLRIHKNEFIMSDDQISPVNKKLICRIINLKKKQNDPTFSVPAHSVYIFLLNGEVGTYMTGLMQKRTISLEALRKKELVEGIQNMIEWSPQITQFTEEFMKSSLVLGKTLFANLAYFKRFTMPEIPDSNDFGLSYDVKGKLCSIKPPSMGLNIICDRLLQFLPFEFFLPTISMIRRFNSHDRQNHKHNVRPFVFRNKYDKDFMKYRKEKLTEFFKYEIAKSTEVNETEGDIVFPFPIFCQDNDTHQYLEMFKFFEIIPLAKDQLPNLTQIKQGFYILTFSDLVSMPDYLYQLIEFSPKACFIFIPANYIPIAILEMKKIFDRHALRQYYLQGRKRSSANKYDANLFNDKYAFMVTLQMTLMKKLRIPIAIIAPNHNVL